MPGVYLSVFQDLREFHQRAQETQVREPAEMSGQRTDVVVLKSHNNISAGEESRRGTTTHFIKK